MANIWVLEEESPLLRATARWLQGAGHAIVPCWSLRLMRTACAGEAGVDLLVMDLTSRDTSCAGLMLKCYVPGLKVLFIADAPRSKWSINCSALFHALGHGDAHILHKPFTGLELLTKVDELVGIEAAITMAKAAGGLV